MCGRPCSAWPGQFEEQRPEDRCVDDDLAQNRCHLLQRGHVVVRQQPVQRRPLLRLHHAHHLGDQAVARAEVIDEHAVAGARIHRPVGAG